MRKEVSCGGVVYFKENDKILFLLIKNKMAKYYGFPKGHVEGDETYHQTAVREIFEETGVKVEIVDDKYISSKYTIKGNEYLIEKHVHYFLAEAKAKDLVLQESEVAEAQWVNLYDALKLLKHNNDKKILRALVKMLNEKVVSKV